MPDPFGTAAIRRQVLAGWAASPVRFREDANAEEDLVLGGYRDRLVVELAQNAADAAARSEGPGRLLLALRHRQPSDAEWSGVQLSESGAPEFGPAVLVAANTGAPLDAGGVQALATLRASAKRDGETVGRFGVGFAAVLTVTDEPTVLSRTGSVRFSAADTRELIAGTGAPALGEELIRRQAQVPVLRLPFAIEGSPPEGYDTAVLLPLRDQAAEHLVTQLLAEIGDLLLLALPALGEIIVEGAGGPRRVLRDVADRWQIVRRRGLLPAAALTGRPMEERNRTVWQVTWALPAEGDHAQDDHRGLGLPAAQSGRSGSPWPTGELPQPRVLYAPTPSGEPLPWPALLIATLPLDPSRRHVTPGPVTDHVLAEAAQGYAELLAERAQTGRPAWPLVVTGLPSGPVDGALRQLVDRLLPDAPILTAADDTSVGLRPRDAMALSGPAGADPATVGVFAAWLAGLVLAPRAAAAAFGQLGVRRVSLADVVELLPPLPDPVRWHEVYTALAPLAGDAEVREALAFLPVPLADGTVARGVRGLTMPLPTPTPTPTPTRAGSVAGGDDRPPQVSFRLGLSAALALLGARAVHPQAAHPLLERLGAIPSGPRALLELPAVRAAVEELEDLPDAGDPAFGDPAFGDRAFGDRAFGDPAFGDRAFGDRDFGDPHSGRTQEQLRDAVLTLVAAAVEAGELSPGDLPWLGDLALPDETGEPTPAAALALPGSPAADWFDPQEIGLLAVELVAAWGAATLAAVGVLRGPGLIRGQDVPLDLEESLPPDEGPAALLDGWAQWCAQLADQLPALPTDAVLPELIAVRDLDAVRPQALPDVVAAIAADPHLRAALVAPARIIADGAPIDVPSYTAWWLRCELLGPDLIDPELIDPDLIDPDLIHPGPIDEPAPTWDGPTALAAPDADPELRALLPPAPAWLSRLDPAARRALGVLSDLGALDAAAVPSLLARLADPRVGVSAPLLVRILARLAELSAAGLRLDRPDRVRALSGDVTVVVSGDRVVVVESPMYRQRTDLGYQLPAGPDAAPALADLLDLPLAGELRAGRVERAFGARQPVPPEVAALLPTVPSTWWEYEELLVDGVEVDWWVEGEGPSALVHAATTDGLARALAWAGGRWELRAVVAQLLTEPQAAADVLVDQTFSPPYPPRA